MQCFMINVAVYLEVHIQHQIPRRLHATAKNRLGNTAAITSNSSTRQSRFVGTYYYYLQDDEWRRKLQSRDLWGVIFNARIQDTGLSQHVLKGRLKSLYFTVNILYILIARLNGRSVRPVGYSPVPLYYIHEVTRT